MVKEVIETVEVPSKEAQPETVFPPFDSSTFPSQLLWLLIVFTALYITLKSFLLPRISSILEMRHDRIAGDLAEAKRLKNETEKAMSLYETTLNSARQDAGKVAEDMREKLKNETESRRIAVEADLTKKLQKAEDKITQTKAKALSEIKDIAQDVTHKLVQKLMQEEPASKTTEKAVQSALKS